jgi:hypothetical protein
MPLNIPTLLSLVCPSRHGQQDMTVEKLDGLALIDTRVGSAGNDDDHIVLGDDKNVLGAESHRDVNGFLSQAIWVGRQDPPEVAIADNSPATSE